MTILSDDFTSNIETLDSMLGVKRNYDIIGRSLIIGQRLARFYFLDGYADGSTLQRVIAVWQAVKAEDMRRVKDMDGFLRTHVPYGEAKVETDVDKAVTAVLVGKSLLLIDGFSGCALLDAKEYPTRSVEEPQDGKVLRGAHDGFVESVKKNTALLRRRIRDSEFTCEAHQAGDRSHTDIVLCYLCSRVDQKLLDEIREKLGKIDVHSLTMGQTSVTEAMTKGQWYNPFPKVRYTERPDTAAACVMEGGIIMLVDNSPAAVILPTSFFDFLQETNDFCFPPMTGTYLRIVRALMLLAALFITPLWYLVLGNPDSAPSFLSFITIEKPNSVPLLVQLLLVEMIVDLLKLASLNTPSVLSSSFSMLGTLILGNFAVQAHWLVPEVLVYMAFVAIANFAQPSFELGYAVKLLRMMLLVFCAIWNIWGFIAGVVVIFILLATVKPIVGHGYMWPLIPFDAKRLLSLLIRRPIHRNNT
ncbi:MAG: spore germination protein [Oscillospiraceae bacterium]|nr:spore germination protein [Oscillospiraceae bacterium]